MLSLRDAVVRRIPMSTRLIIKRAVRSVLNLGPLWLTFVVALRMRGLLKALHRGIRANWHGQGVVYNLRRNIHRLEKGLSFPQRRPLFGEDYIEETVGYFARVAPGDDVDEDSLRWASDVLSHYFDVVEPTLVTTRSRAVFLEAVESSGRTQPQWIPYPSDDRPALAIGYDDLLALARRRRSVRFFEDRPVGVTDVEKALVVAAQSPSSCNRQSFRYLYFDREKLVDQLTEVPGGMAGYRVPSLLVVVGRYRGYFDERDLKAPIVDASLSVMAFILALETLGVSSVCINWPNHPSRERRLNAILELEPDEVVIMMIGIGYAKPDGLIPFSAKRPGSHLLEVNARVRAP